MQPEEHAQGVTRWVGSCLFEFHIRLLLGLSLVFVLQCTGLSRDEFFGDRLKKIHRVPLKRCFAVTSLELLVIGILAPGRQEECQLWLASENQLSLTR